jgi:type IV fimbrial biogenesis protein FimT
LGRGRHADELLDHQEERPVLTRQPGKQDGFTLTELMLAVLVLSILTMVGLPSFQQMMRNYQVRAVAEAVVGGLQRARGEAVSRNSTVQFVLGANGAWTVDYVTKPVPTDPPLDQRVSTEGTPNASASGLASDFATAATTITYNNLGQVVANADASQTLARVNFSATGASETLRVTIGAGGNARVCDPGLPAGNIRAC